jgi:hypothetical protein
VEGWLALASRHVMRLKIRCTCKKVLIVSGDLAGKRIKCPACGQKLTISSAETLKDSGVFKVAVDKAQGPATPAPSTPAPAADQEPAAEAAKPAPKPAVAAQAPKPTSPVTPAPAGAPPGPPPPPGAGRPEAVKQARPAAKPPVAKKTAVDPPPTPPPSRPRPLQRRTSRVRGCPGSSPWCQRRSRPHRHP